MIRLHSSYKYLFSYNFPINFSGTAARGKLFPAINPLKLQEGDKMQSPSVECTISLHLLVRYSQEARYFDCIYNNIYQ